MVSGVDRRTRMDTRGYAVGGDEKTTVVVRGYPKHNSYLNKQTLHRGRYRRSGADQLYAGAPAHDPTHPQSSVLHLRLPRLDRPPSPQHHRRHRHRLRRHRPSTVSSTIPFSKCLLWTNVPPVVVPSRRQYYACVFVRARVVCC